MYPQNTVPQNPHAYFNTYTLHLACTLCIVSKIKLIQLKFVFLRNYNKISAYVEFHSCFIAVCTGGCCMEYLLLNMKICNSYVP